MNNSSFGATHDFSDEIEAAEAAVSGGYFVKAMPTDDPNDGQATTQC